MRRTIPTVQPVPIQDVQVVPRVTTTAVLRVPGPLHHSALMGKPAPQFTLPDVSGKQVKLPDFKGQVVLLNFSTDWSSVYMAQMVQLAGLHREHSARGLKTILVLLDKEEMQTARSFMETYDVSCPLLMGNQQVAQLYGVQEHASATFLVDREGKVSKNSGNLEANIRKLLSEEHLKAPNK